MARKGVAERLRRFALSLPEAYEDFPWGETVVKVNKKVFAFLGTGDRFTVKLHDSHPQALAVPGAVPAGYGLGRAGWVTISLAEDTPPAAVLCDWIEESYRIVAPKRLSAGLDAP